MMAEAAAASAVWRSSGFRVRQATAREEPPRERLAPISGGHHHAFPAGLGDGLDDGRGEDAVHAGHHQQRPECPMMATDSQPR